MYYNNSSFSNIIEFKRDMYYSNCMNRVKRRNTYETPRAKRAAPMTGSRIYITYKDGSV